MFQKTLNQGIAGDNIGVLLRGIQKNEIERGMVLAKPNSINACDEFYSEVYILTTKEGGRHTAIQKGYRPQFYIRTTDITGEIIHCFDNKNNELELVMPGDTVTFHIKLIIPIALESQTRFAIREGNRTIGSGLITKI